MNPVLKASIRYRKNRSGYPRVAKALLYTDHLELRTRSGALLETIALADIKKAALVKGVIAAKLTDGTVISLYFQSIYQRAVRRFLGGIIGELIHLVASQKKARGAVWIRQLEDLGVAVAGPRR